MEYETKEDLQKINAIYHYLDDNKQCMVTKGEFDAYLSRKAYLLLYKLLPNTLTTMKNHSLNPWNINALDQLESFKKKYKVDQPTRKSGRKAQSTIRFSIEGYEKLNFHGGSKTELFTSTSNANVLFS